MRSLAAIWPMPPPDYVKLGPLTRRLLTDARWSSQDEFPAFQSWADDVERILTFVHEQGRFDQLFPVCTDRTLSTETPLSQKLGAPPGK